MPKFRSLVVDADVIIHAHEIGVWDQLTKKCDVVVGGIVIEQETYFWRDKSGVPQTIDLDAYVSDKAIERCDALPAEFGSFRARFDPVYLDRMDDGETESLVILIGSDDQCFITSGDKATYKVLGQLTLGDRGISLEEVLQQIGLGREVEHQFTKAYREKHTQHGEQDKIMGIGLNT